MTKIKSKNEYKFLKVRNNTVFYEWNFTFPVMRKRFSTCDIYHPDRYLVDMFHDLRVQCLHGILRRVKWMELLGLPRFFFFVLYTLFYLLIEFLWDTLLQSCSWLGFSPTMFHHLSLKQYTVPTANVPRLPPTIWFLSPLPLPSQPSALPEVKCQMSLVSYFPLVFMGEYILNTLNSLFLYYIFLRKLKKQFCKKHI